VASSDHTAPLVHRTLFGQRWRGRASAIDNHYFGKDPEGGDVHVGTSGNAPVCPVSAQGVDCRLCEASHWNHDGFCCAHAKIKTARVLAKRTDRIVPVAVCQHPRTMSPRGSESARLWVHQQSMIAPAKTRFQPMREIVQRMLWHV